MRTTVDKKLASFIALSVFTHFAVLIFSQANLQPPSASRVVTLSGVVTVQIARNNPGNPVNRKNLPLGKREKQDLVRTSSTSHGALPVVSRAKDFTQPGAKHNAAPAQGGKQNSNLSELQRLLLAEINLHKHYPLSALRMGQQGTARVGFRLRRNGYIDALAVLRSSGHESLDRAALSAIHNIQPFAPADRLLTKTADLQIDIVFQL